jgi:hypothetical protein
LPHWEYGVKNGFAAVAKIIELPNGDIISSGSKNGNFALLKINSAGDSIWLKDYPYQSMGNDYSYEVIVNHKGNYLLGGESYSFITGVFSNHRRFMELTPDGDTVRTRLLVLKNKNINENQTYEGESIIQTSALDYAFSTIIDSVNASSQTVGSKAAISLMDTSFNLKWTTVLPYQSQDYALSTKVLELADSTLAVVITEESNKFYFFNLDRYGNILRKKTFTTALCTNLKIYSWKFFKDSSIVVVGRCDTDSYIAKLDSIGIPFIPRDTCKTFTPSFTTQQTGDSLQFFNTSNGGYDYASQSAWKFADSTSSSIFNSKIKIPVGVDSVWASLTATNGYGCTSTISKKVKVSQLTAIKNSTNSYQSLSVNVYPNPFSQSTVFNINSNSASTYKLSITNTLGETVATHEIKNQNTFTLNRAGIPSGLYFYVLSDEEGKSGMGKLVVE